MRDEGRTVTITVKLKPEERAAWEAAAGHASLEAGRPVNLSTLVRDTVNREVSLLIASLIADGRPKSKPARKLLRGYLEHVDAQGRETE